ncbi:hypothetical protein GLOIN_2v1556437 [Rhizophagus irregularis DAOM 181602=DAOM 197198]|uniref:Uncharacterized protein n=1 Tax=Rhizophagus irregularis (strain DAOM 181602 / DAOM 197198 / MUCL 43194) TaxID=747089 RepID=A0A2P4QFQ6_RHIID|nr:hypothetical protein GLOIN_2v1556437 [Rhizophagus irregularis DAOM 181602=DAOM 197198]POG76450.1 hypothetical protein GLOIN_2v1556437 [Rhizophagus irregularis DAOM 181602=DAOM 197198]|eukprot:XP_025183316.1 hypothetical protein GLOIN_2v1556437 [Rhizophagus irregularis DAOM 181602=DAOM 197198]
MTKEKFSSYSLKGDPAMRLVKEAQVLKEKPKRAFSSYCSLEEVLEKYGIKSSSITSIPHIHSINEKSPKFKLCIDDILRRIKNMGLVVDSNEAMRCKYISTILHTAVSILGGLVILPQMNVSGEESSSRVNYMIKKILDYLLEEIIYIIEGKQNQLGKGMNLDTLKKKLYVYGIVTTATDWYFILHSTEAIYCTSKTSL